MANLGKLDDVINELENQSRELLDVSKIISDVGTLKEALSKNLTSLEKQNKNYKSVTDELKNSINNHLDGMSSKVDDLYSENMRFYKDLNSLLQTLLEKHRSDIQVEVRNESQQLRNDFKELLSTIDKRFSTVNLLLKISFAIIAFNVFIALKLFGVF